jgi:hypothetical protein
MCDEKLRPDGQLAKTIVEKLLEEGLIPEGRVDAIQGKLLAGTASEGDWRLWLYAAEADNVRGEVEANAEEAS